MAFKVNPNSINSQVRAARSATLTLQPFDPDTARFKTAGEFAMGVLNDDTVPIAERTKLAIALLPHQNQHANERWKGKKAERQVAAEAIAFACGSACGNDLTFRVTQASIISNRR